MSKPVSTIEVDGYFYGYLISIMQKYDICIDSLSEISKNLQSLTSLYSDEECSRKIRDMEKQIKETLNKLEGK
ncbi:MAG: hypothetical protein NC124_02450 [Clostridium sp.]|nr:hypothetical protein [Clostridium sp.]